MITDVISNASNFLRKIEKFMNFFSSFNDPEKARHADISSSINYCNALVPGVPAPLSVKLI